MCLEQMLGGAPTHKSAMLAQHGSIDHEPVPSHRRDWPPAVVSIRSRVQSAFEAVSKVHQFGRTRRPRICLSNPFAYTSITEIFGVFGYAYSSRHGKLGRSTYFYPFESFEVLAYSLKHDLPSCKEEGRASKEPACCPGAGLKEERQSNLLKRDKS
jgi:hypothetical protein